jgi:uncharacterized protein
MTGKQIFAQESNGNFICAEMNDHLHPPDVNKLEETRIAKDRSYSSFSLSINMSYHTLITSTYNQDVFFPLEYAKQVLDKNHTGSISVQGITNDPVFRLLVVPPSDMLSFLRPNNTEIITSALAKQFQNSGKLHKY